MEAHRPVRGRDECAMLLPYEALNTQNIFFFNYTDSVRDDVLGWFGQTDAWK